MNITLTVRGALEEDAALQEIVSILYRKASEARGQIEAGEPEAGDGKGNMYVPTPKPGVPALSADAAEEPQAAGAPAEDPEFAKAVDDMVADAPAAPAKIAAADIQRAATKAMNANKRDGVMAALKAHGGALKDVPEADYPVLLAEIEAL